MVEDAQFYARSMSSLYGVGVNIASGQAPAAAATDSPSVSFITQSYLDAYVAEQIAGLITTAALDAALAGIPAAIDGGSAASVFSEEFASIDGGAA